MVKPQTKQKPQSSEGALTTVDLLTAFGSERKFFEYTDQQMHQDLPKKLIEVCEFVGSKIPSETFIDNLATFIRLNYPEMTAGELGLAFSLACAGRLNVKVEVYGTFGAQMIGAVLNAWKACKDEVYKRKKSEEIKMSQILQPWQYDKMAFEAVDEYVKREKSMPPMCLWQRVFNHILKERLFTMQESDYNNLRIRVEASMREQYQKRFLEPTILEIAITEEICKTYFQEKYQL